MIQYIYFVKCPGCDDEHFDFFDEAKEFALSCLSQKPIITQTEVCRNDFGECTDSCDLGTVWSWEDIMGKETDAEPAISVFTKDDLKRMNSSCDPEFDNIDNSVDFEIKEISDRKPISENAIRAGGFRTDGYRTALACYDSDDFDINVEFDLQDEDEYEVEDQLYLLRPGQTVADLVVYLSRKCGFTNVYVYGETSATRGEIKTATRFETEPGTHDYRHYGTIEDRLVEKRSKKDRKPIPEGMTIEQLVEEMEKNEDEVECVLCQELFAKSDCYYDEDEGYICPECKEDTVKCEWCGMHFDPSVCRKEVDLGWLCSRCEAAIKSRGETLTFKEGNYWDFLDEKLDLDIDFSQIIDSSDMEIWGVESVGEATYKAVLLKRFENVPFRGGRDEIEKVESEMFDLGGLFVFHFGKDGLPKLGRWDPELLNSLGNCEILFDDARYDQAVEETLNGPASKREALDPEELHDLGNTYDGGYPAAEADSKLEELEEAADYRKRLVLCPECGDEHAYDQETSFCLNCGFN